MEHAGIKATWWLNKQWDDFRRLGGEQLMPTTSTYATVIRAFTRDCQPDRAEDILHELFERHEQMRTSQLEPTTEIFTLIIHAWLTAAESQGSDFFRKLKSLKRADEWLEHLNQQDEECGPTTSRDLFLSVLRAARNIAFDRPDILEIANRQFVNLRKSRHQMCHSAYAYLLQVGLRAMAGPEHDELRTDFVQLLVKECCDEGLVSRHVVRAISNDPFYEEGWTAHESAHMSSELFPDWPLPPAWTRNVKQDALLPTIDDFQRTRFKFDVTPGHNPFQ
jgi:pentatricopeptide repeat protein